MHSQQAFTLFELLATIAISSFLLLVALPNLQAFIDNQRLESNVELMLLSIKRAKVSAIKHDSAITLCRKSEQQTSCAGARYKGVTNWSDGWLVFDDSNLDHQYQKSELLLHVVNLTNNDCRIQWNRGDYLSFLQFGVISGGRAGSFSFTCKNRSTQLVINWVGRIRRQ